MSQVLGDPLGRFGVPIERRRLPEDRPVSDSFKRCYDAFGRWIEQSRYASIYGLRSIRDTTNDGTWGPEGGAFLNQPTRIRHDPQAPGQKPERSPIGERPADMNIPRE